MRQLELSPLSALHMYPTENASGVIRDWNFMERKDIYWQPYPVSNYMPICFASKIDYGNALSFVMLDRYGKIINRTSAKVKAKDGIMFYYIDFVNASTLAMGTLLDDRVVVELLYTPNSAYDGYPLYRAFVEFKDYTWLMDNCILLSTQLDTWGFGAVDTNSNDDPITYAHWFVGAIKHSESSVEDNHNTFRDQAWGESLVSRRYTTNYPLRIGDTQGVPFWAVETLNAFCSTEWLFLNDSIKVALSSKNSITHDAIPNVNRATISVSLVDRDIQLTSSIQAVQQVDGSNFQRSQYQFKLATDAIDTKINALVNYYEIPVPNKTLHDTMVERRRGALLEISQDSNTQFISWQRSSRIASVNTVTLGSGKLLLVAIHDIPEVHVRYKSIAYSTDRRFMLADYNEHLSEKVAAIFTLNASGIGLSKGTFMPVGSGLLFNPKLTEITFKTKSTDVYALFINGNFTVNYPVAKTSGMYFRKASHGKLTSSSTQAVNMTSLATGSGIASIATALVDLQVFSILQIGGPNVTNNNPRLASAIGQRSIGASMLISLDGVMIPSQPVAVIVVDDTTGYALLSSANEVIVHSVSGTEPTFSGTSMIVNGPVSC